MKNTCVLQRQENIQGIFKELELKEDKIRNWN